jgi:hypothetical protein
VPLQGLRTGPGAALGYLLIAGGAILLFAVPPGSQFGVNPHIAGVIVILAGTIRLLLLPTGRGPQKRRRLLRWASPGTGDPYVPDAGSPGDVGLGRQDGASILYPAPGDDQDDL